MTGLTRINNDGCGTLVCAVFITLGLPPLPHCRPYTVMTGLIWVNNDGYGTPVGAVFITLGLPPFPTAVPAQ